jgi:hypothetical protein
MKQILSPLGALLASAAAVVIGVRLVKGRWIWPLVLVVLCAALIGALYFIGRRMLSKHPRIGSLLMESGYALLLLGAACAGGSLFWLVATKTPAKNAPELTQQAFSGLVGALTVYAGAVIINLDVPWNPVKKAIQKTFTGRFSGRDDADGKDASDAVVSEDYGARHPGEQVSGWGWQARRLRAKQIGRALKATPVLSTTAPPSGSTLEPGTIGISYDQELFLPDVAPCTWSLASGEPPPGLQVVTASSSNGNGKLTGTPTTTGTFTFSMKFSHSRGQAQRFTVEVSPASQQPSAG